MLTRLHISKKIALLPVAILLAVCIPSHVRAQGFGSISGTVTDPSGSVMPNATVSVTNEATNYRREIKSDAQGLFVLPSLPPATYTLNVEAPGFAKYARPGVVVLADQAIKADAGLQVQQASQSVTVEAAPPQVDTTTSTLNEVVDQKRMVDLPLNGRNAAALTQLVAGAINAPSEGSDQGIYKTFPAAVTPSVNGSRANQTNYNLDGGNNRDNLTNVNQPFPFPDALQEFSVQTSNYSARYGGSAGGVVNIVSKSGTNDMHGMLFEFNRNAVFNARNFFASSRDQLKRNQFGGTIGGPIVIPKLYDGRNRTFFFFGYQGTRIRNTQNGFNAYVPTNAELAGDFSALLNPSNPNNPTGKQTVITDPVTGRAFPGNIIPTNRLDPTALNLAKYLPRSSTTGLVFYSQPTRQDFNEYFVRLDHTISDTDRLSGHYFVDRFQNGSYFDPSNVISALSGSDILSQNALINETHTFRPNLLNEFRVTFNRVSSVGGPPTGSINLADLGVNIFQPPGPKTLDGLNVSGFFSLSYFPPAYWYRNTYGIADDVSLVLGRHNLTFGGIISKGQTIMRDNYLYSGKYNFTADYTNYALASLMLGKVRSFSQGAGETKDNHNWFPGVYIQDDFHASRRLTINMGLRYEPYLVWQEQWNRYEQFRPADYYAGLRSQVYTNAPPGLFFYGDKGVPKGGARSDYNNIAPRVGFAYDLTGDGKTSIRGGGGFFYDAMQIGELNNRFVDIAPFSPQISLTDPSGPFGNPYSGIPNPFPAAFPPPKDAAFPAPVLAVTYDPSNQGLFVAPVTYNWNVTLERQLASTWMARLAYVGSRSTHLTETMELNPAVYTPGSTLGTDARRLFQGYASIGQGTQDINANYHSLQATLQHRFAHGFQILANYTFARAMDDVPYGQGLSGIASQNVSALPWYMPGRHNFDYGRSDFDRRHNFVLSYTWDLPALNSRSTLLKYAAGGWEITGIFTAQSGAPFTIMAGTDASRTGLSSDRGQLVGTQVLGSGACGNTAPCVDYLNRNAFTIPAAGTFGNVGKNSISGPNFLGWDLGAFKTFALGSERLRLQFRGEFFNVPNRVNFGNPNAQVNSGGFGGIRGASDPRIGQLALKLSF